MTKKKMFYILLGIIFIAVFMIYSILKVRLAPSVSVFRQDLTFNRDIVNRLYEHVKYLSVHIGPRSIYDYDKIEATKNYIISYLEDLGYAPILQDYKYEDKVYSNVIVSRKGGKYPGETVVIGAHYDTVYGTLGADDNASAVAILLEICRALKDFSPGRTLKLIFFTLEEPPVFGSKFMGSYIYAREAKKKGEDIRAMVCLEMVGYYSDKKDGQSFPLPFMSLMYPSTPNFIAVVGNLKSKGLVKRVKYSLKKSSNIHVETLSTVSFVPGVDLSDHRSFWKMGYPAVMVTDTAFYRNPNYHSPMDTIDTLNFDKMAGLFEGLEQVTKDLCSN